MTNHESAASGEFPVAPILARKFKLAFINPATNFSFRAEQNINPKKIADILERMNAGPYMRLQPDKKKHKECRILIFRKKYLSLFCELLAANSGNVIK